jgi:hypothetical protein
MEEVEQRYKELRDKYQRDRFLVGEEGEDAAEKLQRIEVAFREIVRDNEAQQDTFETGDVYGRVSELIKANKLNEAQDALDSRDLRDAEWHYLQSVIFYKRSWYLESKKQLELAVNMEPNNTRYIDSLDKLNKILASNTISPDQLRTNSRPADSGPTIGAGNGTCTGNSCLDCLACNACCNCMQCMGGC